MNSRTIRRSGVVAAGALAVALVAASAAQAHGSQPQTNDGNPGMQRMHELHMQGNPGMQRMHELHMQDRNGSHPMDMHRHGH